MARFNKRYRSGTKVYGGVAVASPGSKSRNNYAKNQTGIWRHKYSTGTPSLGSSSALLPNSYFVAKLLSFDRTFGAGTDDPPTATASNNFQTDKVFNGSKCVNMKTTIRLKNTSATVPATLDIYRVALSYYDSLIWDTLRTANSPVSLVTSGNDAGFVTVKTPTAAIISANDVNNFKFQQHYLQKVGTITIGNQDNNNVVDIKVNSIPPKCRRSQTGMVFMYIFHNDTNANNAATLNLDYFLENSFDELPSENRLPFIE